MSQHNQLLLLIFIVDFSNFVSTNEELWPFLQGLVPFRLDEAFNHFTLESLIEVAGIERQDKLSQDQINLLFSILSSSPNLTSLRINLFHDLSHYGHAKIVEFLEETDRVKELILWTSDSMKFEEIQMIASAIKKNKSIQILTIENDDRSEDGDIEFVYLKPIFEAVSENIFIRNLFQKIELNCTRSEEFKYWIDMLSNRTPCQIQALSIGTYCSLDEDLKDGFKLLCQQIGDNTTLHTLVIWIEDEDYEVITSLLNILFSFLDLERNFTLHRIYFSHYPLLVDRSFLESFENYGVFSENLKRNFIRCLKKSAIDYYFLLKLLSHDFPFDILRYIFDLIIDLKFFERKYCHGVEVYHEDLSDEYFHDIENEHFCLW